MSFQLTDTGRVLGRPRAITNVSRIALTGAILGMFFGLFMIYGTTYLYPLPVADNHYTRCPWALCHLRMIMVGLMGFAFLGRFVDSGFHPILQRNVPEISNGKIAVLSNAKAEPEKNSDTLTKLGAESVEPAEAVNYEYEPECDPETPRNTLFSCPGLSWEL